MKTYVSASLSSLAECNEAEDLPLYGGNEPNCRSEILALAGKNDNDI